MKVGGYWTGMTISILTVLIAKPMCTPLDLEGSYVHNDAHSKQREKGQ